MLKFIIDGGWMMGPLVVCSIVALAVIFDRFYAFYHHSKIDSRSLRAQILDLLVEHRVADAARLCASTPGPVSAVLLAGLQCYAKHRPINDRPESVIAIMEKSMDDYAMHAMSAVEKRLSVLATVGTIAPLMGMTGTVLGMITAFSDLASAGTIEVMAVGIMEALITTAGGLLIAVGAVVPHSYFTTKADAVELEIEEARAELLDFVATEVEGARNR